MEQLHQERGIEISAVCVEALWGHLLFVCCLKVLQDPGCYRLMA